MSLSRGDIKRYREHFLRYSASVNYKNITFTLMAMGAVELFNQNSSKLIEATIKFHLANLFALEGNIADVCLNHTVFNLDFRVAIEITRAFDFGYMQVINAKVQEYNPHYAERLTANSCADFMSEEDLATIDNVIRALSYGLIIKFFIDAIPPRMSNAVDLDTAILRSLMIGQKEAPYFSEIIDRMIENLGISESALENGLKQKGVFVLCPITFSAILFPVTSSAGKSYDIQNLSALRRRDTDPLTAKPLTGIYYNKTLFNLIYRGILDVLSEKSIPEEKKQAFMAQWGLIQDSLQKILGQKQLRGKRSVEEPSLFALVSPIIAVLTYLARLTLPVFIPFACQKELGGWLNPLPQLCMDFESALQLATKGFQGAFNYGVDSAGKCLELYTSTECNSNKMKADSLNNPYERSRNLQTVQAEKTEDSFIRLMLYTFAPLLLLLLLLQMAFLGAKVLRGNPERERDVKDALNLLENSPQSSVSVVEEDGQTLEELKVRYEAIQREPNAKRDKLTTMLLCTGCSSSYFKADHPPCRSGAELVIDYDITQLVADF